MKHLEFSSLLVLNLFFSCISFVVTYILSMLLIPNGFSVIWVIPSLIVSLIVTFIFFKKVVRSRMKQYE